MFVIILTLSADFLCTIRALAREFPNIYIDTNQVQELEFKPEITKEEALQWVENYMASGKYDKVELTYREG